MKRPASNTVPGGESGAIVCAWRDCETGINVKNSRHTLSRDQSDLDACRPVRAHMKELKFCCEEHKQLSKRKPKSKKKAGEGREALNADQLAYLFGALLRCGYPWAAVLTLMQLFLGERADCARSCRMSWVRNVCRGKDGAAPLDLPQIVVPEALNGKTEGGPAPLDRGFAALLRDWLEVAPLKGDGGTTWPFENQVSADVDFCLFPGRDVSSQMRTWEAPVSERAYYASIRKAAALIAQERKTSEDAGETHCFTDLDLGRVGTHSIKMCCVSLLAADGSTMKIIAAITRTSIPVLQKHYDTPTNSRKRRAISSALGPVLKNLPGPERTINEPASNAASLEPSSSSSMDRWCPKCGKQVTSQWRFCYFCGTALPAC